MQKHLYMICNIKGIIHKYMFGFFTYAKTNNTGNVFYAKTVYANND